jgi:uncharacterized lipoprotein YehR (DUF1307 family)
MKKGIVLKKRLISITIVLVLIIGIVGCSSKEESNDEKRYSANEETKTEETKGSVREETKEESKEYNNGNSTLRESASTTYEEFGEDVSETQVGNNDVLYTLTEDEAVEGKKVFDLHDYETAILNPVSTFSIDVDTASYSMVRNYLDNNRLPYSDDVRIEEMINYFNYNYEKPDDAPFSINTELGICPWDEDYLIASIGLNGKSINLEKRASTNLVFLMDVSGSMNDEDKLPLLKESFKLLVDELSEEDKLIVHRARRVQRFLSQPFHVAEQFTGIPGSLVDIKDTIKGFNMIMDGELDKYPEAAFNLRGTIEEAIEAGEKMLAEV